MKRLIPVLLLLLSGCAGSAPTGVEFVQSCEPVEYHWVDASGVGHTYVSPNLPPSCTSGLPVLVGPNP